MLYLNVSQVTQIINIYGFVGLALKSKCYSEIPFLTLFSYTIPRGRGVARWDSPCYSQSQVVYAYHDLGLCSKSLSGQCTIFGIFWPEMKTGWGVVIYMYLKHSPNDTVPNICGFIGLTP